MTTFLSRRGFTPTFAVAALSIVALAGCTASAADPDVDASGAPSSLYDEALHALLPEDVQSAGVLTVGAPFALKPSIFTDDAGEPVGISVDLSVALGEVLGVEFEWVEAADPVTAIQSGNIDLSMGFLSDNPTREEVLTMVPQFQNVSTLLVAADSDIADIEGMCGEVLAVVSGSQQEKRAATISAESCGSDPVQVTPFPSPKDALTQLQSGRAEAYAAPRMILEGIVESSGGALAVTTANYPDYPFAMGVTIDNADLAQALAGALKKLYDEGVYAQILDDWDVAEIALEPEQIGVNTGSTAAFPVNQ
jgi:polar amino acid transport system substrate-binding protein